MAKATSIASVASFRELLAVWPTSARQLSRDLGASETTVHAWVVRNRIPAKWWRPLREVADLRGVAGLSLEKLFELYEARDNAA